MPLAMDNAERFVCRGGKVLYAPVGVMTTRRIFFAEPANWLDLFVPPARFWVCRTGVVLTA